MPGLNAPLMIWIFKKKKSKMSPSDAFFFFSACDLVEFYCTSELWGNSSRLLYVFTSWLCIRLLPALSAVPWMLEGTGGTRLTVHADRPVRRRHWRTGRILCIRGRRVVLWNPMSKCLLSPPSSVHRQSKYCTSVDIWLLFMWYQITTSWDTWEVIQLGTF